jgi:hypothetical protein
MKLPYEAIGVDRKLNASSLLLLPFLFPDKNIQSLIGYSLHNGNLFRSHYINMFMTSPEHPYYNNHVFILVQLKGMYEYTKELYKLKDSPQFVVWCNVYYDSREYALFVYERNDIINTVWDLHKAHELKTCSYDIKQTISKFWLMNDVWGKIFNGDKCIEMPENLEILPADEELELFLLIKDQ